MYVLSMSHHSQVDDEEILRFRHNVSSNKGMGSPCTARKVSPISVHENLVLTLGRLDPYVELWIGKIQVLQNTIQISCTGLDVQFCAAR